jgi:hypothetical protein
MRKDALHEIKTASGLLPYPNFENGHFIPGLYNWKEIWIRKIV